MNHCTCCGKQISSEAAMCVHCGHPIKPLVTRRLKSKPMFVILALLLGNIGVHRMYLGDWGLSILYILFCWTFIPAFIAGIEAVVIGFRKDDPRFE